MRKMLCFILGLSLLFILTEVYAAVDSSNPRAILFYVNQYRAKQGLKPLQMNKLISEEAAKHSRDMAKHALPFGHQYFDKRIGYLFATIKDCKSGAENVAYNYKNAKEVVRNWLTSPGHRRNIEGNYNLTGIGLAPDKRGRLYFTQIFLRTTNPIYTQ